MLRFSRGGVLVMAVALMGAAHLRASQAQAPAGASAPTSPQHAVLNRYCLTCHNDTLKTAGLTLDGLALDRITPESAVVWEKVVRKLRTGAMPPPGIPRPDEAGYDLLASHLERELDALAISHPNPGRTSTLHRLNRAEYTNAIRDLLSLDVEAINIPALLPADDSGYGFDNIGDVLSVSPALMERYLSASTRITRLALGVTPTRPEFATYEVSKFLRQETATNEDLPFGSRGVVVRHYFPVDGEYVIKIRLRRTYDGQRIVGLGEPSEVQFRLDGVKVATFPLEAIARRGPVTGAEPDANLEARIQVEAGTRLIGIAFPEERWALEKNPLHEFGYVGVGLRFDDVEVPALGSVSVAGPYAASGPGDTPSRRRIFVCSPRNASDDACARTILSALARRAYRRPVAAQDVDPLLALFKDGRARGGFDAGLELALERILVSPEFLFRIERESGRAPGSVYRIGDVALASRLSFFLWSSIPDEELIDAAAAGKLTDPPVLERQVARMLADPRSKALLTNFAGQWLYLRNVRSVLPDPAEYPEFDDNLRDAVLRETELFLDSMLREDRSVLELLSADYTFLNERLARHYGIPGVYGNHFRRVTLKNDERRGLLGQASILTVTSYANRTSPTLRGKWVLENLLGAPPPPPPPDVPALMDRSADGRILSMRQQMEQHRANPACAVCHRSMDPLGFALENFDAIGKWRAASGADRTAVDPSGELPDGTKFSGPSGLRDVLLKRPEQFAHTVTEKLLTYALGRGLEHSDEPVVRRILRNAAPGNYRWSSLILEIVKSEPFQMRRTRTS